MQRRRFDVVRSRDDESCRMSERGADRSTPRFAPLHPAPRSRLILAVVLGPVLWLVALVVVGMLVRLTRFVEIGLLVAAGSVVVSLLLLLLLRGDRQRQERRYAARA
jgi:hypothetical protein